MSEPVDPASDRPVALLVMGMHRSGTSALARLLSAAGLESPDPMIAPGPDNPAGFWEPKHVVDLNEQMLAAAGLRWDDPAVVNACHGVEASWAEWAPAARQALAQSYPSDRSIVVKDPRLSLFAPIWAEAARLEGYAPAAIVMVRPVTEIAASLAARNGTAPLKAHLLFAAYLVSAERGTRDLARSFIAFDPLMRRPRPTLRRTLAAVLPRGEAALDLSSIKRHLDPRLRHHDRETPEAPAASNEVARLDRACASAARKGWADPAAFDRAGEWLSGLIRWLDPLLQEERRLRLALEGEIQQHKAFEAHLGEGVLDLKAEIARLSDLTIAQQAEIVRLTRGS